MLGITKRRLSLLTSIMLLWSMLSAAGAAAQAAGDDLEGHWAEASMRAWVDNGLLKGYEDGTYRPNQVVTRVELVTLINRAFGLTDSGVSTFSDVKAGEWAFEQIGIGVKAGYIKGYEDGTFQPKRQVTREEASYMITSLLQLGDSSLDALLSFQDAHTLTQSGKQAMANLVNAGILNGLSDGSLSPKGGLTRAQAVTVLDSALAIINPTTVFDEPGIYGLEFGHGTIRGDVVISAAGVTLQNVTITGNLTVTAEVGEGDVYFKGIVVEGESLIQGGGPNSIHFEDSVLVRISVDKRDGSVRLVVAGQSSIDYVVVKSPVKLEESFVTDSGIANVELSDALPAGSQVELLGQYENVDVLSSNIKVKIPSGSISNLNVQSGAASNNIEVSKEASILKLVLDSVAKMIGEGKIENAVVNEGAKGSEFAKQPNKVDDSGVVAPTPTPITQAPGPVDTPASTPTPTPTTPPCTSDACKVSTLEDIVFGDYILNHKTSNNEPSTATGFSADVFDYHVINSVSEAEAVELTISLEPHTSAYYSVWHGTALSERGAYGSVGSSSIPVTLNPKEDIRINISVTSGDGLRHKYYNLYVHYPRSIQEGFKLNKINQYNAGTGQWGQQYNLQAQMINADPLLNTDVIHVYELEDGASSIEQGAAPISNASPNGSYKTAYIDTQYFTEQTGRFYIQVVRNGTVLHEGPYEYNMAPVMRITEDIGYTIEPLTTQELIDKFTSNPNSTLPFSHGVERYWDHAKLLQAVPNAKYYSTGGTEILNQVTSSLPSALIQDQVKSGTTPEGFMSSSFGAIREIPSHAQGKIYVGGEYSQQSENGPKTVYDRLSYVVLYDEDLDVIGYVVIPTQFTAGHVAEGYTPVNTWQPQPE
ncbi:S-layer homology domain-containing protein [Paenibacillus sp. PL2-23]|uniref:S-layer homology domain-containing protein n=1 Tax=Paenibacillus sp. PL2-23 TaxID=2100729 RepID=UPI0030F50F1D